MTGLWKQIIEQGYDIREVAESWILSGSKVRISDANAGNVSESLTLASGTKITGRVTNRVQIRDAR
jgi:hypothetical protein